MCEPATPPHARRLSRGNRTTVWYHPGDDSKAGHVTKRLLGFADVSSERRALYRERLLQQAAMGPGVVPVFAPGSAILGATPRNKPGELSVLKRAYVEGFSLREVLFGRGKPLPSREACRRWFVVLCETLARVHQLKDEEGIPLGLVHRDVTPGNVLVGTIEGRPTQPTAWLNDFGLCHVERWGPLAADETLQGTSRFLAPELLRGEQPTGSSDIYQTALLWGLLESQRNGTLTQHANLRNTALRATTRDPCIVNALHDEPRDRPTASELAAWFRR